MKNESINFQYYNNEIKKPKISFISSVFNKGNYLRSLILSTQYQILKKYEIIFIDDCSTDQSVNIINDYIKIDKRIKLIINKKNKGALYSRVSGALYSKGEYIIFIDSDDLILKEGLYNSYNYIKKNQLSMIQFNSIFYLQGNFILSKRYYFYKNIIQQPFLSYIFYYNELTHEGCESNTALWDKLLERNIALKAINYIGNEYIAKNIIIENDVILLFSLFQMSDSYQYINELGYCYIRNHNDSISNSWNNKSIFNSILQGIFTNIKFLYEKTGNTYLDKLFCIFKFKKSFRRYNISFIHVKKENKLIKNTIDILLLSKYISNVDKIIIANIQASISNLIFNY